MSLRMSIGSSLLYLSISILLLPSSYFHFLSLNPDDEWQFKLSFYLSKQAKYFRWHPVQAHMRCQFFSRIESTKEAYFVCV